MNAYEALIKCCKENNIPCETWESEYTDNLCLSFGFRGDTLLFSKNGEFIGIE